MKYINKRGDAEIISYVFIILIITLIVGAILTFAVPEIAKQQSVMRFNNSKDYINKIDYSIQEVMASPVDSTKKLTIDLSNLYLEINPSNNRIEIYHLMNGNYYENHRLIQDGAKYTYRDLQKLYAGLQYTDLNITTDVFVQNKRVTLYFQKISSNQLKITTDAGD